MKCKVKPYCSVTFRDIRYHQGEEFEAGSIDDLAEILEQVEILEDTNHNEEEA